MEHQIQIFILKRHLEENQITAIASDLTDQYGEYGKRFTPAQVRGALWKALQDVIERLTDDLEQLTDEKRFESYLGAPETWDDPRAELCANCGHPHGDHTVDGCDNFCSDVPPFTVCDCPRFAHTLENSVDPAQVRDDLHERIAELERERDAAQARSGARMAGVEHWKERAEQAEADARGCAEKLQEYQAVVFGAVSDGVYANNDYWWNRLVELWRRDAAPPETIRRGSDKRA